MFFVRPADKPGIKSPLNVYAAQPKCLRQVVVHRVLVDVEAGLH
jgi:hypothetical protein